MFKGSIDYLVDLARPVSFFYTLSILLTNLYYFVLYVGFMLCLFRFQLEP